MDVDEPLRMFISYSHADKNYLENFIKHLVSLRRNRIIKEWTDKELVAGDRFDEEIANDLINSDIVAFLISIDFLNSYCCYEIELKEILERIKSNEPLRIVPIIIRHCDWKDTMIKDFLVIPENGEPVSSLTNIDEAWLQVINEIKRTSEKIRELKKNKPSRGRRMNRD